MKSIGTCPFFCSDSVYTRTQIEHIVLYVPGRNILFARNHFVQNLKLILFADATRMQPVGRQLGDERKTCTNRNNDKRYL